MQTSSADSAFGIAGDLTVTTVGQNFKSLELAISGGSGETCTFSNPCTSYNPGNTADAASSAQCPYTCTVYGAAAGGSRTITVTVKDANGGTQQTQDKTVTFTSPTTENGGSAVINDTYLEASSDWQSVTLQAAEVQAPSSKKWTPETFVTCADCEANGITNTATLATSDGKTVTAPATVALQCACTVNVDLSGTGSYSRAWTW